MGVPMGTKEKLFMITVDFDGVIIKDGIWPKDIILWEAENNKTALIDDCVDVMQRLYRFCSFTLHTARWGKWRTEAEDYCRKMGIPIDRTNRNPDYVVDPYGGESRKVVGDFNIDDRNIISGFPGWSKVEEFLNKQKTISGW